MPAATLLDQPVLPGILPPSPETFAHLAAIETATPTVVSCYVRLELPDRSGNRYRLAAREALRPIADLPEDHAARESVQHDLERITAFLADPRKLPHTAGMALFACEARDLFAMVPLARVTRTSAVLDTQPRAAEAVVSAPDFAPILVALLDRTHARFFRVAIDDVTELPCLVDTARRGGKYHSDRKDAPGWGEHDYHDRIREERHRHAAAVAERLATEMADGPWLGMVLAGPARVTSEQARFLPHPLQGMLLDSARLNPTAVTELQLRQVADAARSSALRRRTKALVAEFQDALGTGWAVAGPRAALRALARGQARLLLLQAGVSGAGFRCGADGPLVATTLDCRGQGEPVRVRDLADETIEEALRQRVEVALVDEPVAELRGIGAVLRFR
jgi:peptide subunit release factor 1 (eRF1)